MELFSSNKSVIREISGELSRCGCCARCTLRYLGSKDMYYYRGSSEDLAKILEQYNRTSENETVEMNTVGPSVNTDTSTETDCKVEDIGEERQINSQSEENIVKNGDTSCITDKTVNPICIVCLGILQEFSEDDFLNKIKKETIDDGYHFTTYMCSLMTPVCVILREHALHLHLKEKFKEVYESVSDGDIATVKDVWKWRQGPLLKELLNAPFDAKSTFEITLTFKYKNSEQECNFLLDSSSSDAFRKRKQDKRFNKKSAHALYTRANVTKAVEDMSDEEFRRSYQCPPLQPVCEISCDIKCQSENVFIAGRYNKYSRELSQTPWIIDGTRKSETSVEELLSGEINKHFKPTDQRFSSSGREDVDVRMLGDGRPFVLELVNPRRRVFSQTEMSNIEKCINASTGDIKCQDLQIVTKEETEILKQGEIDKVKHYQALCWVQQPLSDEQLAQLSSMKDLKILQKTPIRVLHRRPLATRDKLIHSLSARRVNETHFTLDLSTQAGTYIKEFVHGDFGRTRPNLSTIIGVETDILELDVTAIELDWPKKITGSLQKSSTQVIDDSSQICKQ